MSVEAAEILGQAIESLGFMLMIGLILGGWAGRGSGGKSQ